MRPVKDQVVVITGASSGIGREAALRFAHHGASVVLAARGREALAEVAEQVDRVGGVAHVVPTDVGEWQQVDALAAAALERFGRIDTWINDASVAEYATVEDMTPEEIDRVVRVNLLGVIYGCKAAIPRMKLQGAGTLINVGSVLSKRSVPLQSAYCASKHGVKGFSESLRLEMKREHSGIAVCLVMPSSINTPFFRHARSKVGVMPMPIPPTYEPAVVADALVAVAQVPRREVVVGGSGKFLELVQRLSPGAVDWYMLQHDRMYRQQLTDRPDDGEDNLFEPLEGRGSATGEFGQGSKDTSLYTRHVEMHALRKAALMSAGLVGLAAATRRAAR